MSQPNQIVTAGTQPKDEARKALDAEDSFDEMLVIVARTKLALGDVEEFESWLDAGLDVAPRVCTGTAKT